MLLKYFYDQKLAHASYMVGCQKTGEAIIVDPERDIVQYIEFAQRENMKIVGSVETHIHADYVSGGRELAEAIAAKLYVSDEGPADWKYTYVKDYDHQLLKDGDTFHVGNIKFETMHTPGHTPESLSFLVTDVGGGADKPMGLFTGDFVFVGSTGRPDLLEEAAGQAGTAEPGARDLFRSLEKFRQLPDYLQIWPSHGAGSACGKGLGAIPSSTVGYEKMFNEALQFQSEDDFVKYILTDQPEAPPYFAVMKSVNKHGPTVLGNASLPEKLDIEMLSQTVAASMVLDTGASENFAKQHVPGTINIPVKYLASQGGWFIDHQQPIYLIGTADTIKESVRVLREIGVDKIVGYFDSGDVLASGLADESFQNLSPKALLAQINNGEARLIDIRRRAEWNEAHIAEAEHVFLGTFDQVKQTMADERPIVLQCRSGARSAIGCSILQAAGIKNVINLEGGIVQWQRDQLPVITDSPELVG